jgi:thioesterase domain-containing protein
MHDYAGDVTIFRAKNASTLFVKAGPQLGWTEYIKGEIEVFEYDCDHFTMMEAPTVAAICQVLNERLIPKK